MGPFRRAAFALACVIGMAIPLSGRTEIRPNLQTYFEHGVASPDEVMQAAGNVNIDVTCPEHPENFVVKRGAHVTIEKPVSVYDAPAVFDAIQQNALNSVWDQCGHPFDTVSYVAIIGPNVSLAYQDFVFGFWYYVKDTLNGDGWGRPMDIVAAHQHELNDQAQRQAQQQADAQAQLARQQQAAVQQQQDEANTKAFMASFWFWVRLAIAGWIGWTLWARRENIAHWYYFHFQPHPAEPMVRLALSSPTGSIENANALAHALGELPPQGGVLRRVRLEQAERLVGELRVASAARAREFEQRARQRTIEEYEKAAFYGSQEAIALAVVALERAKAAYQTAMSLKRS